MRNLKRALSLTLASVMLLGMMVVGGSAVGYPDVDDSQNVEAIEVLQAVGIMGGDNNGNFNPDDYVTREQMAVIMSQLLKLDYNYYKGTNPFSDVPEWAAPYVAACAANGITAGIGDGLYGSKQNIQAVQAALMMLKALGYFQYAGDYEGGYVLATVKQATEVGLFKGIESESNADLTRNQIAQMVLNSLKADMVRFTGDPGITYTGSNGESWVGGYRPEYTPRTSTDPKYNQLIDNKHSTDIDTTGQYYVQLGEELYNGDLVQRYDSDIFERPGYTWTYKTELIGTYVDHDKFLARYTTGVSGRTLYDLLNNITIAKYKLYTYVDGHVAGSEQTVASQYTYPREKEIIDKDTDLVRSNTDDVGITDDGVETEVYLDRDNEIITIVSMHTWLAKANNSYNEARESASLKVYETSATGKTKVVEPEDAREVTGVTQDSYYLVKMSDKDSANLEVVKIMEPQILTDSTITKFSTSNQGVNGQVTKLTTGGTEYKKNTVAYYDDDILDNYNDNLLSNATYNVYLDQNGYFAGVDLYEGDKNYVFITGYDMRNSNLSVQTATANGIFLDGTMENITVNVQDTNKNIDKLYTGSNPNSAYYLKWASHESDGVYLLNRWYTYTKTDSGVYTLKPCYDASTGDILMFATSAASADLTLKCDRVTLDGASSVLQGETMKYTSANTNTSRAYGEDASVFITVDTDDVSASIQKGSTNLAVTKAITDVRGSYTGVQNVELIATSGDRVQGQYLTESDTASATGAIGENVYTVYDKDHFIIGSVILGSAKGGVENYAYILNPVKSEERKDDGYYYWEFECVYQGEIKTFQAKTKYLSTIDELKSNQYRIVELRFNGEYVVDCETLDPDEIYGDVFTDIRRPIADTENVYDVVMKNSNFVRVARDRTIANTQNGTLYLQGKTLYVLGKPSNNGTANDEGLTFVKDAKAVVRQVDRNGDVKNQQFDSIEQAYSWLNDADDNRDNGLQYKGIISAVLNSQGVAEWVVFYNDNPYSGGQNNTPNTPVVSNFVTNVTVNGVYLDITRTNVTAADQAAATAELNAWLFNQGYMLITPAVNEAPAAGQHIGAYIMATRNGTYVTLIPRYTDVYTIRVNGTVVETVNHGGNSTKITNLTGTGTGYVSNGSYASYASFTAPTGVTAPVSITTGYVLNNGSGAVNGTVTTTDFTGSNTFTAAKKNSGDKAWPSESATSGLAVGGTQYVTVTWTANPGAVKGAVISISGKAATESDYTLTAAQLKVAGSVDVPVIIGNTDMAANGITVTVKDGDSTPLTPKAPVNLGDSVLTEGAGTFADAYARQQSGESGAVATWAGKVLKNLAGQGSGVREVNPTLVSAFNNASGGAFAGAAEGDIAFVFPINADSHRYILAIYDDQGVCKAAGASAAMSGSVGLMYIRPNPLSVVTTTGVAKLDAGTYTYVIYQVASDAADPSGAANSWTVPVGAVEIQRDTFTVS